MYVQVSLRGMHRLIRIDTLRRVHNVGFLVKPLKPIEILSFDLILPIFHNVFTSNLLYMCLYVKKDLREYFMVKQRLHHK